MIAKIVLAEDLHVPIAKTINTFDSGQPGRIARTDLGRFFSFFAKAFNRSSIEPDSRLSFFLFFKPLNKNPHCAISIPWKQCDPCSLKRSFKAFAKSMLAYSVGASRHEPKDIAIFEFSAYQKMFYHMTTLVSNAI